MGKLYSFIMKTPGNTFRACTLLLLMAVSEVLLAQAVPPINQCRRFWVLNSVQEMNFGGFSVEAGTATITMNNLGALTSSGLVSLSTSIPVAAWTVDVSNTLDPACASYGFTLELPRPPSPLQGGGTPIPFDNVLFSAPALGLSNVTFPQVIPSSPGNTAPFTMTIYGEISPSSPQAAGEYSRNFAVRLLQSNRRYRLTSQVRTTSIVPLTIAELTPMSFGTIAGGPVSGTVILGADNSRIATGDAQLLASGPGSAATFQLTGEPNLSYSITFSDGVLANAGGQQMTATTFTHNGAGIIPGGGSENFQVGATLNVGSNQASGTYSTSNGGGTPFTVTINYN